MSATWFWLIGNPASETVTLGIVSAWGRQLGQWAYRGFHPDRRRDQRRQLRRRPRQRGGADRHQHGQLPRAGRRQLWRSAAHAEGIGFAIPVRAAKTVMDQIIAHGLVVRGWMGAEFGPVQVAAESVACHRAGRWCWRSTRAAAAEAMQPGDVLLRLWPGHPRCGRTAHARGGAGAPAPGGHLAACVRGSAGGVRLALVQRPSPNRIMHSQRLSPGGGPQLVLR